MDTHGDKGKALPVGGTIAVESGKQEKASSVPAWLGTVLVWQIT
jgi:hypothetical protein